MSFGTEIYNFITDINNKEAINIDNYGNATFEAEILYTFRNQSINSSTDVKIIRNGYNDGKVSLGENDELNVNFLHLDFTPDYQKYKYDSSDSSLTITGSSQKMGGNYTVKITTLKSI